MTETRRLAVEKYGIIGAVATVVTVAVLVIAQLAVISRWTGAIEEQAKAQCKRIEVLESFKENAPVRYVTREEHSDIKERLQIQREQTNQALGDIKTAINRLSDKLDQDLGKRNK